jgi:hypothetical protein
MRGTICSMRATAGQISYLSPERMFALSNLISDNLERKSFCMQLVVSERIGLALDGWLSAFTCDPASPRTNPGFPVRCSRQVCVCGFLYGKPHEAQ